MKILEPTQPLDFIPVDLRDNLAAAALPECIKAELGIKGMYQHFCPEAARIMARNAYAVADAMIEVRGK